MQPIPPGPQFQVAPTWLGLIVILAAGLAFLAFIAVLTAVLASGKPIVPMQRIKALAAMLALIVPALAVVVLVGWFWAGPSTSHNESRSARRRPAVVHTGSPKNVKSLSTDESGMTKPAIIVEAEESPRDGNHQAVGKVTPSGFVKTEGQPERQVTVKDADGADVVTSGMSVSAQSLTEVLRVRGTASAPPDWAGKEPVPGTDGVLVALSSQRFATIAEAEEQVTAMAVDYVEKFYHEEYPLRGDWTVPVSVIKENALNAIVGEMFDKDFGNGVTGMMYRAHLRLDINPALRNALHASWNEQLVSHRLMELGGGLGLATLILATCAGYFRLDDWTGGKYRRRLKIAAASLFAAGSLVTSVCLLMA
jgi:hypothetical protein